MMVESLNEYTDETFFSSTLKKINVHTNVESSFIFAF